MNKLCVAARWQGDAFSDFYPWLETQIAPVEVAHAELGPTRQAPTLEASVAAIDAAVARLGGPDGVVVLGHSAGCQALLRYLAGLPADARVAGVVLVAAWTTIDAPWREIEPWLGLEHDWERVRGSADRITVLLGDDDPFTRDHRANAAFWRERLGVVARVLPGRKHFNRPEESDVLDAVRESMGAR